MNWGTKIVIGMAIAMTAVVCTGIYMVSQDTDSLEDNNYYENGLHYDDEFIKKENVLDDDSKASISRVNDSLIIQFAKKVNEGTLLLRRPSNRALDKKIPFHTLQASYQLSVQDLERGVWLLRLDWKSGGVAYLQEQRLYIQ